jgi:dipeptidyl aminopeptidase/acylaminoacyl peptidase
LGGAGVIVSSGDWMIRRRPESHDIGGSPTQYPDRYLEVSPLSYVGMKTPPTITLLGTSDHDIPTDQALTPRI